MPERAPHPQPLSPVSTQGRGEQDAPRESGNDLTNQSVNK